MKAEFNIGDKVTFKPYEKACKCVVKGIQQGMHGDGRHIDGSVDDRVFYRLSGEAVSITSGGSIVESALYEEVSK